MDITTKDLLKKYWGYDNFRPLQQEIIDAALGNGTNSTQSDILALMPTGMGKSICFQIPILAKPGIGIVVSPLIALINDQVKALIAKGIRATYISSSLTKTQIDTALDNCIYGNYKFLYIAPERVSSLLFLERYKKMDVNFVAVDEAHCISQWGYDFRPAYLKIADLRILKPNVPIIALTATATPKVGLDIIDKLKLKDVRKFKVSFKRDNIIYNVVKADNKKYEIKKTLQNTLIRGSIIIYTNTRKDAKELSLYLGSSGINNIYYHAGLDINERQKIQDKWTQDEEKIIIATKAFGLGIDKPNVRLVIHYSPPSNIEDYYQESGRAGRDKNLAYSILFYNDADIYEIKRFIHTKYPSIEYIQSIYNKVSNFLHVPIGGGYGDTYFFNLEDFATKYKMKSSHILSVIKILEQNKVIKYDNNDKYGSDKIVVIISPNALYNYRIKNLYHNKVIEVFLRLYGGELFYDFCNISLHTISKFANLSITEIKRVLEHLDKLKIINYMPSSHNENITYLISRADSPKIDIKSLMLRKSVELQNANVIENYVKNRVRCRQQIILDYFGETDFSLCNKCDTCVDTKTNINYRSTILEILKNSPQEYNLKTIIDILKPPNADEKKMILQILRDLLKEGFIKFDADTQVIQLHGLQI